MGAQAQPRCGCSSTATIPKFQNNGSLDSWLNFIWVVAEWQRSNELWAVRIWMMIFELWEWEWGRETAFHQGERQPKLRKISSDCESGPESSQTGCCESFVPYSPKEGNHVGAEKPKHWEFCGGTPTFGQGQWPAARVKGVARVLLIWHELIDMQKIFTYKQTTDYRLTLSLRVTLSSGSITRNRRNPYLSLTRLSILATGSPPCTTSQNCRNTSTRWASLNTHNSHPMLHGLRSTRHQCRALG